jgi:HD-GYP domain-containing protein (c-di-GMP phosphodiesterase class II)
MPRRPGAPRLEHISRFVAGIIESRDPDLGEHHHRLGESAVEFARHADCSSEETAVLVMGARLHDIGKLAISDHILNKPARLTAAELALVRQHAEIGHRLLSPLGLDTRISDAVYRHHENYDGSGYPEGLAGEAIPLAARILRILDSYDAMTETRSYRQGISRAEALRRLHASSQHYDPRLLAIFCRINRAEPDRPHSQPVPRG